MSTDGPNPPPPLAAALGLEPHPEGGWFRETWRSERTVSLADGRLRPTATAILFLLGEGDRSAWHLVSSDELGIHAQGPSLTLELGGSGHDPTPSESRSLGVDSVRGEQRHILVPAGVWQSAKSLGSLGQWTLVGCTVAPAFQFSGFEMAPAGWEPGP